MQKQVTVVAFSSLKTRVEVFLDGAIPVKELAETTCLWLLGTNYVKALNCYVLPSNTISEGLLQWYRLSRLRSTSNKLQRVEKNWRSCWTHTCFSKSAWSFCWLQTRKPSSSELLSFLLEDILIMVKGNKFDVNLLFVHNLPCVMRDAWCVMLRTHHASRITHHGSTWWKLYAVLLKLQ